MARGSTYPFDNEEEMERDSAIRVIYQGDLTVDDREWLRHHFLLAGIDTHFGKPNLFEKRDINA